MFAALSLLFAGSLTGCRPEEPLDPERSGRRHCLQAQMRRFADRSPGSGPAAALARRLGRPSRFLVGLGNDLEGRPPEEAGIYTLPTALDLHYAYLTGLPDQAGGWPDWNPDGAFVDLVAQAAAEHCTTPMFTLYAMAGEGEANFRVLVDPAFMAAWWRGYLLLLERLGELDTPAIVHVEPDFWGFAQKTAPTPDHLLVLVGEAVPECADLPSTLSGFGRCVARLAADRAPEVALGLHASQWAGPASQTARFLAAAGADEYDLLVVETLDRDAGCFEAGRDAGCQRDDGPWYWDETNQRSPTFHEHIAWASELHQASGRPLLWWQMPLGVPAAHPGGRRGQYRDNRVRYLFGHPEEFADAGGLGAVFGKGAADQTDITSDEGQFLRATRAYYKDPADLP